MVKARVERQMRLPGALRSHIGYLKHDGVTRDGSPGKLFDAAGDDADGRVFAERCEGDRHHFRFIVSPDGDLAGIARAIVLSRATMRNIRENLVFAFAYNAIGIPIAAGVLYPAFGILLSPIVGALAMSLSSVSVIANALRLRTLKL
jgi:hypothetical protein